MELRTYSRNLALSRTSCHTCFKFSLTGHLAVPVLDEHQGLGDQLEVLDEVTVLGLVNVDRAPGEATRCELVGEFASDGFLRVRLDRPAGLAAEVAVKVVGYDFNTDGRGATSVFVWKSSSGAHGMANANVASTTVSR